MPKSESFAETVARLRQQPRRPERVPAGRQGDRWRDPAGLGYHLTDDDLAPERVVTLARGGARVVYDTCGCGGTECRLDWVPATEVADLLASGAVPTRHGRADMEHWQSGEGKDLVVLAVGVRWGNRVGR